MSNNVLEQIDFIELMKQHSERNIPWCNMTCKNASIYAESRYYWSGKYSDLGTVINGHNEREIMFEILAISKNRRVKEIEAMGYEITHECVCFGGGNKFTKIYYIAKRKGVSA